MRKILNEDIDFSKVAEKAVAIIKGKGHNVIMFTDDGMETSDPEAGRRFYVKEPNYMVTIEPETAVLRVNKNSHVELNAIEGVLKQLRNLSRNYMMKFELKVFGKEIAPKDFAYQAKKLRDQKMNEAERRPKKGNWKTYTGTHTKSGKEKTWHTSVGDHKKGDTVTHGSHKYKITKVEDMNPVNEASFSRLHGHKKTSYQTLESTKLIVRHRRPVDEEKHGARSRQISSIFIERAGERFKFPHNHLAGARAMARHLDEGGEMHDTVGQYIIESVGNLKKLVEFANYARRNKLINEESEDVVKIVRENIAAYKRELQKFQGATTYAKMCEKIADREGSELEEEGTSDLKDMFTVRKFDEKIGETLPLIKKLVTEKNAWRSMIEEASEEAFVVTSTENLIEKDAIEFDSPTQKLGYKIRTLSERVTEENDLSKFVHKIGNKMIEGTELSKFEKSVMRNVLEHIVVVEEETVEDDGLTDKLEEAMAAFARKMELLEFDHDWDRGLNFEGPVHDDPCSYCEGTGEDIDGIDGMCAKCHGTGEVNQYHGRDPQEVSNELSGIEEDETCKYCHGWGEYIDPEGFDEPVSCPHCDPDELEEDPNDWADEEAEEELYKGFYGDDNEELGYDPDTQWMDPAGGIHYHDEDDPAAMYEEARLRELAGLPPKKVVQEEKSYKLNKKGECSFCKGEGFDPRDETYGDICPACDGEISPEMGKMMKRIRIKGDGVYNATAPGEDPKTNY